MSKSSNIEVLDQKELSSILFARIKDVCIRISQQALLPSNIFKSDSPKLISSLKELNVTLNDHYQEYKSRQGIYILSPKLADYIFFPLSNLLKQESLANHVICNLFHIIEFLISHCWYPNNQFSDKLLDQLFPVVLFLIKEDQKDIQLALSSKPFEFKAATYSILNTIILSSDDNYFESNDAKRLSLLGDTSTVLLSLFLETIPQSSEEIELSNNTLLTMKHLFTTTISHEKLSHIFPGVISTIINFCSLNKNVNYIVLINIIDLLMKLIVNVFNDKDLGVSPLENDVETNIESLPNLLDQNNDTSSTKKNPFKIDISITADTNHRSNSWLKATSNKLKISLNVLFKDILFSPNNQLKLRTKPQLLDAIIDFVHKVSCNCFWSLFNELFVLNIDILASICYIKLLSNDNPADNTEQYSIIKQTAKSFIQSFCDDARASTFAYKITKLKLEDMIDNKLSSIIMSSVEDKTLYFLIGVKFHFQILYLLTKDSSSAELKDLRLSLIKKLHQALVDNSMLNQRKSNIDKNDLWNSINQTKSDSDSNKLDNIELPPHINANKLSKVRNEGEIQKTKMGYTTDLIVLANKWSVDNEETAISLRYFEENITQVVEAQIGSVISSLCGIDGCVAEEKLVLMENLLMDNDRNDNLGILQRGIALWIANQYMETMPKPSNFDISEFVDIGVEDSNEVDDLENLSYLLVNRSQDLIESIAPSLDNLTTVSTTAQVNFQNKVNEKSYSIALDSIGILSNRLPKEEFKEHFLMDYLFPIFEALTYNSSPRLQNHAQNTIMTIAANYYDNSILKLVLDNLEYLIDSLSLKLSVPGSLTPALPGILLIILKISGLRLLLTNQLSDIINQMFINIDSYHGYSVLVEGMFVVFDELISQIKQHYLNKKVLSQQQNNSLFKPWGMTSINQVLSLIDDSNKVLDPFGDYDPNKEYFHRKKDAPFAELDSDDEETEEQPTEAPEWNSVIDKPVYFMVQRIFIYGFRLLSHPSISLRIGIVNTIINCYDILSTNYQLLMPLLAEYWPSLVQALSLRDSVANSDRVNTTILRLLITILETDGEKQQYFMTGKFIDLWDYLLESTNMEKRNPSTFQLMTLNTTTRLNSHFIKLLLRYLIVGINNYEKSIPDTKILEMVKFIKRLGVCNEVEIGTGIRNVLWVLKKSKEL